MGWSTTLGVCNEQHWPNLQNKHFLPSNDIFSCRSIPLQEEPNYEYTHRSGVFSPAEAGGTFFNYHQRFYKWSLVPTRGISIGSNPTIKQLLVSRATGTRGVGIPFCRMRNAAIQIRRESSRSDLTLDGTVMLVLCWPGNAVACRTYGLVSLCCRSH